jgi:CYTH domain-containing protein
LKSGLEIERRFVIKKPDESLLCKLEGYSESLIEQIYLDAPKGRTHRIRSRSVGGVIAYTETEKIRVDAISAIENEREIDAATFAELSKKQRKDSRRIIKRRLTFSFDDHLFEVDIYPQWQRSAVMEVELPTKSTPVSLPPFIELIKEVTGEKRYSNSSMASAFPEELI